MYTSMLYNNVCFTSLVIYIYNIGIKGIPATYLRHIRNNIIYYNIILQGKQQCL